MDKSKLIARIAKNHPAASVRDIASQAGVSHQYVHSVLRQQQLGRVTVHLPADLAQRLSDRGNGDIIAGIEAGLS